MPTLAKIGEILKCLNGPRKMEIPVGLPTKIMQGLCRKVSFVRRLVRDCLDRPGGLV